MGTLWKQQREWNQASLRAAHVGEMYPEPQGPRSNPVFFERLDCFAASEVVEQTGTLGAARNDACHAGGTHGF